MSLNLALVISGEASGAKAATDQTTAGVKALGVEAGRTSAAMDAANDRAVSSSRRVTDALATQAAAERSLRAAIDQRMSISANVPMIGTPFANDNGRAADIDAFGRSLDALRARYNPLFAASKQYEIELDDLNAAHRLGAITSQEHQVALDGLNNRYTLLARQSAQTAGGLNVVGGAARLTSNQLLRLSQQGNDVITMWALGAPTMMIFASQAGQVVDALESGPRGLRGSLAGIAAGVKSTASTMISGAASFVSFSNPVGLVATGIIAGTAALLTYATVTRESIRSIDDILKDHEANIKDLKQAWAGDATAGIKAYESEGTSALSVRSVQTQLELRLSLMQAAQEAAKAMVSNDNGLAGGSQFGVIASSEFSEFGKEIDYLRGTIAKGAPDVLGFRKMVEERWKLDPTNEELTKQAAALDKLTDAAARAALALPGAQAAVNALVVKGGRPDFGEGAAMQADLIKNAGTLYQLKRDQEVALGRIGARSPQELADAARAAERAKPITGESFAVRQLREESAAALAAAQAQHQLNEARQQRARDLQQTIAGARVDLDLVGQTTAATEAYRLESQLLAQVQEEAARNHVAIDQAEIASIHQKAIEYGKLRALQQARDTIYGQVEDLEVQRAELALVGASKLAHDRIISALRTEQEIRRLGIDVYGQEAEAMRANTAAASELADATARASLQQQLQFDREQMFRSPTEQNVASTMRDAGLDYDPNSAIAQQIRYNEQLKTTKAAWEDIFSTVSDGIDGISDALFSGGSIEDAIRKAGQQLAKTMFDMALTNPLKNWLTGGNFNTIADLGIFGSGATSGKGGGFGGVLGQMLGAQKAVASMQVQAASVFINGSPIGGIPGLPGAANDNGGGILGWVKSLFGGANDNQPFKANTTLTDLLGGGGGPNTAATAAKLLGGLGSPLGASSAVSSVAASAAGGGSVVSMIREAAAREGIDPDIFLRVAKSEGGLSGFVQSNFMKNGIREPSFGPMQLLKGGPGTGFPRGLGNAFQDQTGLDPADPANMQAGINFAAKTAKQDGWRQWYGAKAAGVSRWEGINPGVSGIDPMTTESISKLGNASTMAAESLSKAGLAGFSTVKGLTDAAGGLTQFGQSLSSFMSSAGGGGSGWFQNLAGMFGGPSGAINSMMGISPMATADILSGSWGLFANGAAFLHGNVVPFAKGDVFSSPTYFPMSGDRTGMLGEDGEEAIMPLRRGPDGRLGVVNHQPLRAPRAANGNAAGSGSSGGLTRAHIEGIVNSIADKLKINANIINLNDGSDMKRWMMSEDGHSTVAVVNKRLGG
ncbi:MAG: hypothetical protein EOR97_17255 [Mesorhizobium sp.]|nr:MAG: hypothetical protein EOR97_17255 [Mesorhizobium sp.]